MRQSLWKHAFHFVPQAICEVPDAGMDILQIQKYENQFGDPRSQKTLTVPDGLQGTGNQSG